MAISTNKIKKLVAIAKSQTGNGPYKYRKWFYGTEQYGVAWCAVFVSWCLAQAGITGIKTDGAGCFAREYQTQGKWYESEYSNTSTTPKVGDIVTFTWNYAGRYPNQDRYYSDHVGIVYGVDSSYIYTVEGNAGPDNDSSTVKKKMYPRSSGCINGYYRLNTEREVDEMNFKKGDKSDGVLALKALIQQAHSLGIISNSCDNTNSFGGGTHRAVLEIQKKYHLERDGIAGTKTITALKNAVNKAIKDAKEPVEIKSGWGIGIRFMKICLRALHSQGKITSNPDDKFGYGKGTAMAIKEVQKKSKLKENGVADAKTADAIERLLCRK